MRGKRLGSVAADHPLLFVVGSTLAWLVLLTVFTGIASSALQSPFGGTTTVTLGHLAAIACVLSLTRRLGWLEASGIARAGRWPVWLIAMGSLVYFASASLYSFYGAVAFDFSSLVRSSAARVAVLRNLTVASSEEILFRGLVLHALVRAWGNTRRGLVGGVVLTSLLFSVLHLTQVFTHGVSPTAAVFLTLQTCIISIWWGALVWWGGTIWPAVMLHFAVNSVVAVQGLSTSIAEPAVSGYIGILWFSVPLGAVGIGLLAPR